MKAKISKLAHVEKGCKIGKGVVIHDCANILQGSIIEDDVEIFGDSRIEASVIKKGSKIFSSVIENSEVGEGNTIGPFAHLRPYSKTEEGVKIGNFVEIKNSCIGAKSKVSHLAYVGDAIVGKGVNIGCGAIFVNYNGKIKQKIVVGDGAFIGSNCNIIAPVEIAPKSYICAGTTVTQSTNVEDFVIGRVEPTTKKGKAKKYLD